MNILMAIFFVCLGMGFNVSLTHSDGRLIFQYFVQLQTCWSQYKGPQFIAKITLFKPM